MSVKHRGRLLGLGAVVAAVPLLLTPLVAAQSKKTINVTVTDTAFRLSAKNAPVGSVTFVIKNTGKAKHDFKVGTKKSIVLAPGKTAKLTVVFTKAGPVAYTSTVTGDAKKGLKGTFTLKAAPTTGTGGNVAAGKTVFISTGCGACHTLKAANGTGTIGPSLDTSTASRATVVSRVTNGKAAMPAYAGQLTGQQIQDVADFVVASRG
jgi:mono/diheme cytochrome c family protein